MINRKYNADLKTSPHWLRGVKYYVACNYFKRPYLVNLEVTKHCNAKCDFCACWQAGSPNELKDYAAVVRRFRPVVLSITGGEPLVRKDLINILKRVRPYCHYMVMITNAGLLTEEIADNLSGAGLNQLAISLDYLDERHDAIRHIPGLFKKITDLVPRLTAKGYKIFLNTVIMEANLDHIIPLAHKAASWGAGISYSAYCTLKKQVEEMMVQEKMFRKLEDVINELKRLKHTLGNIRNSDYYLNGVPEYFRKGGMGNCKAGRKWVQVAPDGFVQPCSELTRFCRYDEYKRENMPDINCTECWYTCRGEAEAPHLAPGRLLELMRS